SARAALAFPRAHGFTLRYAMKANPQRAILSLFRELGLHIDASSDHEVERALRAGFRPEHIRLTAQAPSRRLRETVESGVLFSCCSLHQLDRYGTELPGRDVTLRVNPGLGSGSTNRTNIGSGSDPAVWTRVARMTLDIVARLPDVTRVNLGGGFKVARMAGEQGTDLAQIGGVVRSEEHTSELQSRL